MDREIINIKDSDELSWELPSNGNKVIIEITERSKDKRTKGGIYACVVDDVVYAEGDGSHEADVAEVWGIVRGVPPSLYYDGSSDSNLPWETTLQIKVGDMVWFDYFASVNCTVLESESKVYYVIDYCDIFVAKRGDEIIPLNGYCLCEPIEVEHKSQFAVNVGEKYRKDKAIVRYLAEPNKRYRKNDALYGTYNNDILDVKEGDTVILRSMGTRYKPYFLERLDLIATFSEQPYYVIQRRMMELVL